MVDFARIEIDYADGSDDARARFDREAGRLARRAEEQREIRRRADERQRERAATSLDHARERATALRAESRDASALVKRLEAEQGD